MHTILFYDLVDDYLERRAALREEHFALARESEARGELLMGGALADPIDTAIIIFRGDCPAAAEAFAKADPYVRQGLVKSWRIRKWTTVFGNK